MVSLSHGVTFSWCKLQHRLRERESELFFLFVSYALTFWTFCYILPCEHVTTKAYNVFLIPSINMDEKMASKNLVNICPFF